MSCCECGQEIKSGEIYVEVKRRGEHDVYRETDSGHRILSMPLHAHINCPS